MVEIVASGPSKMVTGSVGDPDPSDPYVFGPPGSGSEVWIRILLSSNKKIVRNTLIPTVLRLLFDFFIFEKMRLMYL